MYEKSCIGSLFYCLKCKKKTESDNIEEIQTPNGSVRSLSTCCVCNSKKSSFVSLKKDNGVLKAKSPEGSRTKGLPGGDIVDIIGNTLGEIHLPGHNFTGPGTKLKERLARGDKGINRVDELARGHDIAYSEAKDKPNKKECVTSGHFVNRLENTS